jgi:hypothetical protein
MAMSNFDKANIGKIINGRGDWFTCELLRLIAKATPDNRAKLASAFPEEVAAYENWFNSPLKGDL